MDTWSMGQLEAIKIAVVGMELKLRSMEKRLERLEAAIENLGEWVVEGKR